MPTPHKHAALIKQWADNPSQTVWFWSPAGNRWESSTFSNMVAYTTGGTYALGEKPTQPPPKMCVLAGVEFPAPETVGPAQVTLVYFPDGGGGATHGRWDQRDGFMTGLLEKGYVHLTREAAEQHSRALLAANKQAIEGGA